MGWGTKFCSNGLSHMTNVDMEKTLKNLLLWNQRANALESWYAVSSTTKSVQMMTLG